MGGLEGLKTDADVAVYLRNAALALSEIAQQNGMTINAYVDESGYVNVRFGNYDYTRLADGYEAYKYEPIDEIQDWRDVTPQEIQIGHPPKREVKRP